MKRTTTAALVAPLWVPAGFALAGLFVLQPSPLKFGEELTLLVGGSLIGYALTFSFGYAAYRWLPWRDSWWAMPLVGALIGLSANLLLSLVLWWPLYEKFGLEPWNMEIDWFVDLGAPTAVGALTGATFWLIVWMGRRDSRNQTAMHF